MSKMETIRRSFSAKCVVGLVMLVVVLASPALAASYEGGEYEADRILSLPGQPTVDFDMYAGYITVNERAGRAHFYYFVEAEEDPENKPLVFWFNGGPGCSSMAYGFAEEIGPFFINPGGKTLRRNPHAANKAANVLFVESPAGVGFSYTNTSSDLVTSGDNRTAIDNFTFVRNWFKRFPHYKGRPFFLTGESYAGYYVPQLARLIHRHNKVLPSDEKINFKGFMVGNPVIDAYNDNWGYIDFLYHHAMISDVTYSKMKEVCNFTHDSVQLSHDCIQLMYYEADNEYGIIDPYSIYAPACVQDSSTDTKRPVRKRRLFNPVLGHVRRQEYDPCTYDYAVFYFNRPDVQMAMHANVSGHISYPWGGCSDPLFTNWQDSAASVLPIYEELLEAGLRLWVFSGDADSIVPVTGSRYGLASLKLPTVVPWYSWYHHQQVGGREIVYKGNLTLVTVRGAGHEVPLLKPAEWLQVFESFLGGSLLPNESYL
ncbi:hypothetical protein M758_7G159200 [Ceratodon purpureus]|nr:hypothetical protein M758_7G159200 [Ceratodon purpureus]